MRILFFTEHTWAFGYIYHQVSKHLHAHGIDSDVLNWKNSYRIDEIQWALNTYDYILSPEISVLIDDYQVPVGRLIFQPHGEPDLLYMIDNKGLLVFDEIAGFFSLSNSITNSAMTMGVTRVPYLTPQGIDCSRYNWPLPTSCQNVGYSAVMTRQNRYGVEINRGHLAQAATQKAGLNFYNIESVCWQSIPSFYNNIDAYLMSSLQEGAPVPPLEACASGRLVIGTPVGHWSEYSKKKHGTGVSH